jgi:hypothetical protein
MNDLAPDATTLTLFLGTAFLAGIALGIALRLKKGSVKNGAKLRAI